MVYTVAEEVQRSSLYVSMTQFSLITGVHNNPRRSFLKIYQTKGLSRLPGSRYTSCVQAHAFLGKNISGCDYEAQCSLKGTDVDCHLQTKKIMKNEKSTGS